MLYIAENLKALRKKKDLTQEEVAGMLNVSPQSVSKWERGDTMPDITMLPALSNLYEVSVDALIGMDKINNQQTRNNIFTTAQNHITDGEIDEAVEIYSEALKTFPNDEGIMSDLAIVLALSDDPAKLSQAVSLCERVLANNQSEKVHHTTRAALCFIYMKVGDKEKAFEIAQKLPHLRESREIVLGQIENSLSANEIDSNLKLIGFGNSDEQDIIEIDFGLDMIAVCTEHELLSKIKALREEFDAPKSKEGLRKLPQIRIRDKAQLSPSQVRVRHYANYLLDKEYKTPAEATTDILKALRTIASDDTM
ncbi:MAG: helix-turn-helix domain-containing protein [Oscillospiraceae bacterium]|nr:helix-turn-helix domain-containing protein [Oscillospiraceae bacterium]